MFAVKMLGAWLLKRSVEAIGGALVLLVVFSSDNGGVTNLSYYDLRASIGLIVGFYVMSGYVFSTLFIQWATWDLSFFIRVWVDMALLAVHAAAIMLLGNFGANTLIIGVALGVCVVAFASICNETLFKVLKLEIAPPSDDLKRAPVAKPH